MSLLISESYRQLNADLHRTNASYGISSGRWAPPLLELARSLNALTVLDYGAGRCRLRETLEDLSDMPFALYEYDPAIERLAEGRHPADIVICTDVLEHIEPDCLESVLDDLLALSLKAVFLAIATGPAKKVLADGRNAHLIQQPAKWWLPKLMARWELLRFAEQAGEFVAIMSV